MVLEYLKTELDVRTKRNPNYSLRSFAQSLNMNSGTLSSILNGKRKLTPKCAKKIVDQLTLDPMVGQSLLMSAVEMKEQAAPQFEKLDDVALEVIAGWEHFAILSFLETKETNPTLKKIASRLYTSTSVVFSALSRMERLGLVTRERGRWKATGKQLATSTDVPNASLRRMHLEYLKKSQYSLEHHPVEDRDFSGITMAISKKRIPQAKKLIQDFRRKLCRYLEGGEQEEVYRLNIELFPLKK